MCGDDFLFKEIGLKGHAIEKERKINTDAKWGLFASHVTLQVRAILNSEMFMYTGPQKALSRQKDEQGDNTDHKLQAHRSDRSEISEY